MRTQLLAVNGVHMNVEVCEARGVHRRILVLLHGFTGSAAGWGSHVSAFAEAGLRVIALDMLGHGRSEAPRDPERYSIEHCSQDILEVLRTLGVERGESILLGYSMGGRIALYTAFSDFFAGLILESASPGLAEDFERAERRASDELLAQRIERDGVPPFVDYWESLPLFASQRALPGEICAGLHEQRLQNRALGLANSLRGVGTGTQPSLYGRLPTLRLPVLLIVGALDGKYSAIAYEMAQSLPEAQVHIVAGAGHTTHFERPEQFDRLVVRFCEACSQAK
jgi:2-succinyl-6-hydroxy-2,4-cyclohexadiene-1-carboxylate synthase